MGFCGRVADIAACCRSFQIPVTIEIGECKKVVGMVDRALMMIESAGAGKR